MSDKKRTRGTRKNMYGQHAMWDRLKEMADRNGTSMSAIIAQLVNDAYDGGAL